MGVAPEEARAALGHGDVPVGAVVLVDGEVGARRHNERGAAAGPTARAEGRALRDAAAALGRWRLDYTLPPAPRLNHEVPLHAGVRADEAATLLTAFFAERRGGA